MMLGLRKTDPAEMDSLFLEAYRLNPKEKMLNYIIGKRALEKNQPDSAEQHFKLEMEQTQIADNFFNLARLYFMKENFDSAAWCLQQVIRIDPLHPRANNNLALLFFQVGKTKDAKEVISAMQSKGMGVSSELMELSRKNQN
jgi:tetratricopeptide (TPR) repeat protein